MHDGGISTSIFKNNEQICTSIPHYSKAQTGHGHGDMVRRQMSSGQLGNETTSEHIQSQGICSYPNGIPLKKGDSMYLQVQYDFKLHPG